MAARARKLRNAKNAIIDGQHYGDEPKITSESTSLNIINAYNWYNYFHTSDDAKSFVISYLRKIKADKSLIKKVYRVDPNKLRTVGWNYRILENGGELPDNIKEDAWKRLSKAIDGLKDEDTTIENAAETKPVISIQERIENKASELIADIETEIDEIYKNNDNTFSSFSIENWMKVKEVKPALAKKIAEYYKPLYDEVVLARSGKDEDLKYAYRNWKKIKLRKFEEFLASIISAAEIATVNAAKTRKPRAKKVKPSIELVKTLKYKDKDEELKLTSIKPVEIMGSDQLWVINTKTRALSVYNARGPAGLTVKGTTIVGFDEKTSVTKIVRNPEEITQKILDAGKIALRKVMSDLTTKEKPATGRINSDVILLRTIK